MKIDAERLRGFLDCMHDEADEREKHSAQIRSIVKAAKEVGYDTKAIRKVFARERMEEAIRIQQDDLLETYEHALGGKGRALVAIASGVPVGEACEANGVHRATVARARHVAKQVSNATHHDPETGEIEERSDRQSAPCDGEASAASNPASASSSPPHTGNTTSLDASVPFTPTNNLSAEAERLGLTAVVRDLQALHDDLTIPAHLRRVA